MNACTLTHNQTRTHLHLQAGLVEQRSFHPIRVVVVLVAGVVMDELVELLDLLVALESFSPLLFAFFLDLVDDLEPIAPEVPTRRGTENMDMTNDT